jgi:hypothetical protein
MTKNDESTSAEDLMQAYGNELGLMSPLTVSRLIEAHRLLRQRVLKTNDEWRSEVNAAAMRAAGLARQSVLTCEYVAIDKLRTMTLGQISELVATDL